MATALRRLRLKRISLVDMPANESARVVLFKREGGTMTLDECDICKAELEGESRGNLSDSDFAAVWTDSEGRKQRKLPIHDAAHVRNALARFNQTEMPAEVKAKAKAKLEAAKHKFDIGDEEGTTKQQPGAGDVHVDGFVKCKKCDTTMAKGTKTCPKCGAVMSEQEPDADDEDTEKTRKAAVRPKEEQMDEKLKADLKAAQDLVTDLQKQLKEVKDKYENTPEQIEARKMAALPESVRKQMEEDRTEIRKLRDEKAEADQIAEVRKSMPMVPGKAEDVGRLLKRASEKLAKEDVEALTTLLRAASAQIEKGGLYREIGRRDSGGNETPLAKVERMAQEIVSKSGGKMAIDAAYAQVFRENPGLYEPYKQQVLNTPTVLAPAEGE